jgi:hypothetical protein
VLARIREHAARAGRSAAAFRAYAHDEVTGAVLERSATPVADVAAFDAVWDSMHLVKAALNARGIYVNEKARGVVEFMRTFGDLEHSPIVPRLWDVWVTWERRTPKYREARAWCLELAQLAEELDRNLNA